MLTDPRGLRSRVCCKPIDEIGGLARHCFIETDQDGKRTTHGLMGGLFLGMPGRRRTESITHIDSVYQRSRGTFADTRFSTQTTQFNRPFFNREASDPSGASIFAHEYRHLMEQNNRLFRPGDEARDPAKVPGEIDADAWAKKFWSEKCECGGGR
jgi:hypothetical protein